HDFIYSKDLFDHLAPHFAFFAFPDAMGMVTDSSSVIYDNTANRLYSSTGFAVDSLLLKSKVYLQKLYDDLDKR
ncbi:MAG: LTA synthase family protein, partial [Prevotella sp.]|nr:LTA synthase family protein [Prevotella sp.]